MLVASPRLVPAGIMVVSLIAAGILLVLQANALAEKRQSIQEEGRLGLESALEHVEEYFDAVYSTLLFMSQDEAVKQMRLDSRDFIQRLFNHQWEEHRLSEVYVVERGFTGTNRPFLTFEHGSEDHTVEEMHSLERELEEYAHQKLQLRQFEANTNLQALLSPEIHLCTETPEGARARGFVYSVPISSQDGFRGLVAGMIPTHVLQAVLRKGGVQEMPVLVNGRGEIHGGRYLDQAIRSWFEATFTRETPVEFFRRQTAAFRVGRWTAQSSPARIVSADKWWVVYLYDEQIHLGTGLLAGMRGAAGLAVAILLAGTALGLLSRGMAARLQQQVRHLQERQELERQVQEASEREQRRIGDNLHEDLCQRLAGIRAASQALQKRLKKNSLIDADLAAEIAGGVHESLRQAQQLADELQPVTLLDAGFAAAIQKLAIYCEQRSGIPCAFDADQFSGITDPATATHLYRIVQEALNNAAKHSGASQVTVEIRSRDGVSVSVRDNGAGFTQPGPSGSGSGMGLRIMQYRADLLGGRLMVNSTPGKGTEVICQLRSREPQANEGSAPGGRSGTDEGAALAES